MAGKNDRVETDHDGETPVGTIKSISKATGRATVILDGGERSISGHISLFRPSGVPVAPDVPSPMDRWDVQKYVEHDRASEETTCFHAVITLDGKPVIQASNDGRGGCNRYYPLPKAPANVVRIFESAAAAWFDGLGGKASEPDGLWIDWKARRRPYNVTARAFAEEFNASMAATLGTP
jgi:hypothetical protein